MRSIVGLLIASISTSATVALAQDGSDPDAPVPDPWKGEVVQPANEKKQRLGQGFYVRLGGSTGFEMGLEDSLSTALGPTFDVDVSPGVGLDVRFGARGGHFGSEVQVEWIPNFTVAAEAAGNPLPEVDYRTLSASGNLQLIFLTGRVQPYLTFGAGGTWISTQPETITVSGIMIRGGGGVDVFLNDHIALATDVTYVYLTGDASDADYLAFDWGLKYVF